MSLTQEELKIVEQMKQMGATNAQITGFIGKGRLGITPTFPVERVQEQRKELGIVETGQDIAQMFQGLMNTAKKTYKKQTEALGASMDGKQSIGKGFAQAFGIGLGGVSEGVGEVMKGGVKALLPQEQEEKVKQTVAGVVQPLVESDTFKYFKGKYDSLTEEQKRDFDAIAGTAMFGLDVLGAGAIGKGVTTAKKVATYFPDDVAFKNADEVIEYVAKTPDTPTGKALAQSLEEAPELTLKEKWIGIEPSYKKKIQNQPEKMQEYINVVKARNNDLDMPSVYEYAGDNARLAVADMERILNSTGSKIGQTRSKLGSYTLDIDQVKNIENSFIKELDKLNLKVVEGRILKDMGKVSKVSNSELNALKELYGNLNVLKRSPNLTNGIDLRNVFDNKINFGKSAREISNILDPVSRSTREQIAKETAKLVGKTEAKNIADYSDFMRAYDDLKRFTDKNAGGEYLLRVFMSGRGGEAGKVIKTIADYTGKDLSVDAVMMTLVTDLLANPTQKNLFRQEITKAGVDAARILSGDPTGAIPILTDIAKKRILDPEDILKSASGVKKKFDSTKQGGFVRIGKETPKTATIDNLNPTGSVFVKYTPEQRAKLPIGKNITTLDKTMEVSPDELITIYRGADKNQTGIVAGDFITTNKKLAQDYAGNGKVLELKVKAKDVLDDITEPLGEEYIYRPKTTPPKSKVNESVSSLNDTTLIKEAKKYKSAEEFVKAQGSPLLHGTGYQKNIKNFKAGNGELGKGLYLTPNEDVAGLYGNRGKVYEIYVPQNTTYKVDNFRLNPNKESLKIAESIIQKGTQPETLKSMTKQELADRIRQTWDKGEDTNKFWLEKAGYKALTDSSSQLSDQVLVFNPKDVLTKSQLTDIWNKANKK